MELKYLNNGLSSLASSYRNMASIISRRRTNAINERTHLLEAERSLFSSLRGETSEDASSTQELSTRSLGTFEGVFAPVSLSMLSSLLFLRVGYILGNTGFLEALLQYGIAYTILVATILSISAIATNGAVEGGGVYFMLSRTLGMEFGGSVGILFWFANVVCSALYLMGCTEGLVGTFGPSGSLAYWLPVGKWWIFLYASLLNTINMTVCIFGSKVFGKASTFILTVVCVCTAVTMVSFFEDVTYTATFVYNATSDCIPPTDNISLPNCTKEVNGTFTGIFSLHPSEISENFMANIAPKFAFDCSDPTREVNFATVFGVLFSGVTGIMSGANLSGELVSPRKNIPRGTLSASLFTLSIFLILTLLTAMTCTPEFLLHDCMYMTRFSIWPPIVSIGIFMATLSASLNNLIGASKLLEAVAKDVIVGNVIGFIKSPLIMTLLTWLFVELFLLMGSLNAIAQLCSVLFLMSYATVNLACLFLDLASAPNFRPSFKFFSWHTCLGGLIGTSAMMFMVSPLFTAIALLLCLSLVFALNFLLPIRKENWGSISQALLFHQVRKYLLLLDPRKAHVKFWRPQVLLLVSNPRTSCSLIDFVNALKKGGLYVIGHVYNEELQNLDRDPCVVHQNSWLSLIDHLKVKAFVELTLAKSLREGIQHLVRISGIGAMKPNTIIMGYLDDTFHGDDFQSPYSAFATNLFEGVFPPLNQLGVDQNGKSIRMTKEDYVGTIIDLLKMEKNVCLTRHFQKLDKGQVFRMDKQSIFGTRANR